MLFLEIKNENKKQEPSLFFDFTKQKQTKTLQYINLDSKAEDLELLLKTKGWLTKDAAIKSIEKPGEGNMNVVMRIKTDQGSFILKQSRPYVQKYQQIEAPLDRIDVEYQFYDRIKSPELEAHIPKILAYDKADYLMMIEDLGQCEDLTFIYKKRTISSSAISKFTKILNHIHQSKFDPSYPKNTSLRQLNYQHIFVLPFMEDNGFQLDDIQSGLQDLSLSYKKDEAIKTVVKTIGDQYLENGDTLIHGDYYPGSWMKESENLYIIDPEFSFNGFAEFDLGVMSAHLIMANENPTAVDTIFNQYTGEADKKLMNQVAGIEIMRRLIGLAQLPLKRSIEEKANLLKTARKMILS